MKINLLPKHVTLKIISCILGYSLWFIASSSTQVDLWLAIPVCFYNIPHNIKINAPETVRIHVLGSRHALHQAMVHEHAAHIDGEQLHQGKNIITLSPAHLLLPTTIKLVEHSPCAVDIELIRTNDHVQESMPIA